MDKNYKVSSSKRIRKNLKLYLKWY